MLNAFAQPHNVRMRNMLISPSILNVVEFWLGWLFILFSVQFILNSCIPLRFIFTNHFSWVDRNEIAKCAFLFREKKNITVTFWSTRNTHMHTSICLYVYICITHWIMKYVEGEWFRIDIHLTISIAAPANAKSKYKGANHTFSRKCKLSHKSHSQRINSLYLAAQWNI